MKKRGRPRKVETPTYLQNWLVNTDDGEKIVAADRYTEGTDYVQFWVGNREAAIFPRKSVGSVTMCMGEEPTVGTTIG